MHRGLVALHVDQDLQIAEPQLLGDLSEGSTFEVENPASALGPTGLIEVRVSGRTDPNFGQSGVFVSAEVEGVIDR